jgi:colicin import membrane protein|tara:strand:+ start:4763 stop:5401 length:639 start_codon:yes stop_codon:yes gene_type:complete
MTVNLRYLHAAFVSFCFHACIFLYLYGTFDSNTSQTLLISQPLWVELKFESPIKTLETAASRITESLERADTPKHSLIEASFKFNELAAPKIEKSLLYSNFDALLEQEEDILLSEEQKQINLFAQKIIQTIEDAWMQPRNIPDGLIANLRLHIKPTGRISKVDLLQSSGNIRFDNSALQAVRRVETLNFFKEIPSALYEKEFKKIAVSFNPS